MVLPLSVDVGSSRRPWANWALIAATVTVFFATTNVGLFDPEEPNALVLDGVGIGMLGHVLLHANAFHLFGNMMFLWVFGNAVCARIGSPGYLLCYAFFAAGTAVFHSLLSDTAAIGASGAVNGVVGMFFVFHPKDYVTFGVVELGRIREAPAWVLVALWLLLDLLGLLSGSAGVAYAGHLGGFATGFFVAVVLLENDLVADAPGATLLDLNWRR